MLRRRFLFWVGFGLFGLAEKLRANSLDDLAAALMRSSETKGPGPAAAATPEHWSMAGNSTWQWYEREHLIDGRWKITGITTPVNRVTGERYTDRSGYLDESLVPARFRPLRRRLIASQCRMPASKATPASPARCASPDMAGRRAGGCAA